MNKEGVIGCSAEGHVSHVLSSRMSSRPMGWSSLIYNNVFKKLHTNYLLSKLIKSKASMIILIRKGWFH